MSTLNNSLLLGQEGGAGYAIERSLRFNSSDSAFCSRTFSSVGNRRTWTWAGWVKRSELGDVRYIFSAPDSSGDAIRFGSSSDNKIFVGFFAPATSAYTSISTAAEYRDPSAWLHIVVATDTTQSTASDRVKLYVNGTQVTAFSSATYPAQNAEGRINTADLHRLGRPGTDTVAGYLADVFFIDGQALTPSSFTEVSATTGQLIPKQYTGSFGTNGFWLKFSDNSAATATTLGKDYSGNSNNWTPNNLSVTAGAGNDSLVDTPTSYGTGNSGGDVRGNYCTWNPLVVFTSTNRVLANGNLDNSTSTGGSAAYGTFSIPNSGKWYFEVTANSASYIGIDNRPESGSGGPYVHYNPNGQRQTASGTAAYGSSFTTGDVIGVAVNVDAAEVVFYRNGVSQGAISFATAGITGKTVWPLNYTESSSAASANFGQRPFAYTAPSGYKALCDTNLPAPVVAQPSTVMDVKLYTGNGSTQTISGLGFSPDLVWIKRRSSAISHALLDVIRGTNKVLYSNLTAAEDTYTDTLTAFNSDGFTLGSDATWGGVNASSSTYVAWAFDAGSSTVSNTQGSITSSVRANASAGFSIVTYTGSGANATVGHGLGVAPSLIIIKSRSVAYNWIVYHQSQGATKYLSLNQTIASTTLNTIWNNTAPTSSLFTVGTDASINGGGDTLVAYCFAPVAGYSSFGSYTGNGSSDGPFVYTGFRPRWIMYKSSSHAYYWVINDAARDSYNSSNKELFPNDSLAETVVPRDIDLLSNGFKLRNTGTTNNQSGATYIYAAFAENPFQYARAR